MKLKVRSLTALVEANQFRLDFGDASELCSFYLLEQCLLALNGAFGIAENPFLEFLVQKRNYQ